MASKKWLGVAATLILCSCVSQIVSLREYLQNWMGYPIDDLKEAVALPNAWDAYKAKIGWKETTYNLPNGNWVYVELDRKDCFVHWEVNSQDIIIGAHTEGDGCRFDDILYRKRCLAAGVSKCP